MKHFFYLFMIGFFAISIIAEDFIINQSIEKNQVFVVSEDFSDSDSASMIIRSQLRGGDYEVVDSPKGKFVRMIFPGAYTFNPRSPGEPQRAVYNTFIEAPIDATVKTEITSVVENEYTAEELGVEHPIYPNQPSICKQQKEFEFAYFEAAYKRGYSKSDLVHIKEVGILRGFRLFVMEIKLCDYNPKDQKIKFFSDIEVKITFENVDLEKTKAFKKKFSTPPVDNVCRNVLTSSTLRSLAPERKNGMKYLIVSHPMFSSEVNRFVAHKQTKNIQSKVLYTDQIGSTKEAIRSAISNEYHNPADGVTPTFLLLVGDKEQIPTYDGTEGFYVTDLNYSAVSGNDYLPDMLSGRFSAQNLQQLIPQIDKTIEYENGDLPDYEFLKRVVFTAGWDSYWAVKRGYPHIRYAKKYYVNSAAGYENVEANTFLSSASQQNVSQIKTALNQGAGLYNYTAHGTETDFHDPQFTIGDVNNMTNHKMYTFVIGNCCLTNSFEVATCFGEAWLRAANKGAIGFMGGSSYTYWDEDYWFGVGHGTITQDVDQGNPPSNSDTGLGCYDSIFEQKNYFTNAGMMLAGNLAVQLSGSNLTKYYFEVYHLLGDPGLQAHWVTPSNPPSSK